MSKKTLCKSCNGPLEEYDPKEITKEGFCPFCVDEKGNVKNYADILQGMIEYITSDHPEIPSVQREEQAVDWLREGQVWGARFKGTIIKESLENPDILATLEILSEKRSKHDNPETNHGFDVWQIYEVLFYRTDLDRVLDFLKLNLRQGPWWVDVSFEDEVHIIFKEKVFSGDSTDTKFRKNVNEYAEKMGCPEDQYPFSGDLPVKGRTYKNMVQKPRR